MCCKYVGRLGKLLFPGVLGVVMLGTSLTYADLFTLDPISPTLPGLPAAPADILTDVPGIGGIPGAYPPPSVAVPMGAMGLVPGDVIDAISDGMDPVFVPGHIDYFSVSRGSVGVAGTGVFTQSTILDTPPGVTPGHAGDIFVANGGLPFGLNLLAPAGFGWTLGTTTGDEANTNLITPTLVIPMGDNVNSYDIGGIGPGGPILFSLAPGSPSLIGGGFSAADIFISPLGGGFGLFAPAAALGLPAAADIDALALFLGGPIAPGTIEFSLSGATSGLVGASGADVLTVGGAVVHSAASLGLLPSDDLDALDVGNGIVPEPSSLSLLLVVSTLGTYRRSRK